MRKAKVLIYEPYIFGVYGNTRYLLSIFDHYDRDKFEITLLTPFENDFTDLAKEKDINVDVLEPSKRLKRHGGTVLGDSLLGRVRTVVDLIKYNLKLKTYLRDKQFDILQCHSIRALLTAGFAARFELTPCFWYIKGELQNPLLDRVGFALANKVLFQTETNKRLKYPKTVRFFEKKISLNPNGIDLDEIKRAENSPKEALRQELKLNENTFNIVFVGQLVGYKGINFLLQAFSALAQSGNAKLYLVGGPSVSEHEHVLEDLKGLARELKIESDVEFLGWRRDALEIVSLMDAFVLPSLTEGVPKSVLEAMALGKAVIATKVGGTSEIVQNQSSGILIPPGESKPIEEALITLRDNLELRLQLAKSAKDYAHKNFSIQKNIRNLESIYCELSQDALHAALHDIASKTLKQVGYHYASLKLPAMHVNYYSICAMLDIRRDPTTVHEAYLKIVKADILDNSPVRITDEDRALSRHEYESFYELHDRWPADSFIRIIRPICYSSETNCLLSDRVNGIDYFPILRKALIDPIQKSGLTLNQAQDTLEELGRSLRTFHLTYANESLPSDYLEKQRDKIRERLSKVRSYPLLSSNNQNLWNQLQELSLPPREFIQVSGGMKGIDIRNILYDLKSKNLWLLDPGRIRIEIPEADLARLSATIRILFWGSFSFQFYHHKTLPAVQALLQGYQDYSSSMFRFMMIKELMKHWDMAHDTLEMKPYPKMVKPLIAKLYIDRFYEKHISEEINAYNTALASEGKSKATSLSDVSQNSLAQPQ